MRPSKDGFTRLARDLQDSGRPQCKLLIIIYLFCKRWFLEPQANLGQMSVGPAGVDPRRGPSLLIRGVLTQEVHNIIVVLE